MCGLTTGRSHCGTASSYRHSMCVMQRAGHTAQLPLWAWGWVLVRAIGQSTTTNLSRPDMSIPLHPSSSCRPTSRLALPLTRYCRHRRTARSTTEPTYSERGASCRISFSRPHPRRPHLTRATARSGQQRRPSIEADLLCTTVSLCFLASDLTLDPPYHTASLTMTQICSHPISVPRLW